MNLEEKEEVKKIAKFLYNGIPLREAVELDKRVEYFRGKKMFEYLSLSENKLKLIKIFNLKDKEATVDIKSIGSALLKHGYIHASKTGNKSKRELIPINSTVFEEEGYYTWLYQTSSFKKNFLLGLIIFGFLSLVMFPIWPYTLKIGVWYLSVTFLLLFSALIIFRAVLYILLWTCGVEFWIFPHLFDDDASIVESFVPFYSLSTGDKSFESWASRGVILLLLLAGAVYVYNQPTELDEIIVIQRQFVSDLYEGKLLSDNSAANLVPVVPKFEDLQKQFEEEDKLEEEEEEEEKDEL